MDHGLTFHTTRPLRRMLRSKRREMGPQHSSPSPGTLQLLLYSEQAAVNPSLALEHLPLQTWSRPLPCNTLAPVSFPTYSRWKGRARDILPTPLCISQPCFSLTDLALLKMSQHPYISSLPALDPHFPFSLSSSLVSVFGFPTPHQSLC